MGKYSRMSLKVLLSLTIVALLGVSAAPVAGKVKLMVFEEAL